MRVSIITLINKGGMLHYTSQLANHLAKFVDVTVILPTESDLEYFDTSVDIQEVNTPPKGAWLHKSNLNVARLLKIVSSTNPDIVHISGSHPWYLAYWPLLKLKRYPVIVTLHDVKVHIGEDSALWKLTNDVHVKTADHLFVHGMALKDELLRQGFKKGITVVPLGDFAFLTDYGVSVEEDGSILFFGRIQRYKGLQYLLEALPAVREEIPHAKLIIAGEGDISEYHSFIDMDDDIELINYYVSDQLTAELFRRAAVVVLPYVEGSQTAIISIAYAFKKPVVVTDVGSIPELVDDAVTGFIVPPRNAHALADAIVRTLKNKDLRKQMGENACQKMKDELSWDRIAEKVVDVYDRVLTDHQRNGCLC